MNSGSTCRAEQTPHSATPVILAIVMALGIVVFHIFYAASGFPHYRDQHLGPALIYAREGIDLLRPTIIGFNANGTPTPQEFPIWQAAASLPMRWFGEWFGWANIVSLLLFASVYFPVYRLGKQSGSCATGWWCLALLLCQPLVWLQAGRAGTDGTSIAAAIWFFYCGCKAITGPRRFWWTVAAAATGALAATLKLPFMMTSGIAMAIVLISSQRREPGAWLASVFAGVFSAGVFLLWTHYTDSCLAQAEFPYVDLRLSHNPEMVRWYFGDWSYRFDAANWVRGGWRMLNSLFGSFALAALPLAALGLKRAEIQSKALLAGAVLTTAVFTHLVLHHSNYYLIYSLPVALLGAPVAELAYRRLREGWRWPAFLLPLTIVGTALLGVTQGLVGMEAVAMDPYRAEVAQKLRSHTDPDDRLLIVGGGWGGDYLFLSDRAGLSIWSDNWLADAPRLNRLRQLGYTKLVMVSESPLLAAQQMTNPGGESYRRKTHYADGNSFSAAWPTVYSDEDLLIRKIPKTEPAEVVP